MGNNIRSSSRPKALAPSIPMPPLADAMDAVHLSVDRFCLLAGVEALAEMMEEDATTVCGARHRRHGDRRGYRWGRTHSEIGYHGGKVKVARPRVRDRAGKEVSLESWQALRDGNLLLEWALNLMVLNVSTRKYHRAVRLPEGDLAKARGDGTSKSAVSRRFVALSRKKMKAWLASANRSPRLAGRSGAGRTAWSFDRLRSRRLVPDRVRSGERGERRHGSRRLRRWATRRQWGGRTRRRSVRLNSLHNFMMPAMVSPTLSAAASMSRSLKCA